MSAIHSCGVASRPCGHVDCRYHLAHGERIAKFAARKSSETCALDVADQGRHTEEQVAALLGICRQAISLVEIRALAKLRTMRVFSELATKEATNDQ